MRRAKVVTFLTLAATLAFAIGGCAPEETTPESEGNATAPQVEREEAPSAPEGEVYEWTQATPWTDPMLPQQWLYKRNDMLAEITGGRLIITTHPAGAIMGAKEVFDATNDGTIDLFNATLHTWIGKLPASPFFSARPLGLEATGWLTWYEHGGDELLMEMLKGFNFGCAVPAFVSTPEDLCWSNVKMTELQNWKGVKFRTKGLWAEVLQDNRVGAAVTTIAGGELYSALERHILDATEYSTAATDKNLAFYEVCKYVMVPGIHQPCTVHMDVVNRDSWNELPEDLQAAYIAVTKYCASAGYYDNIVQDAEAFRFFQDETNVEIVKAPKELQQQFLDIANDLYKQKGQEDPFFLKCFESQKAFMEQYNFFHDFQTLTLQ
ncbi:MAG: hypothetical protein ACTSV8_09985 [Candidatus Thorarchaeota archaeon]